VGAFFLCFCFAKTGKVLNDAPNSTERLKVTEIKEVALFTGAPKKQCHYSFDRPKGLFD
jgi:hypothetical protein